MNKTTHQQRTDTVVSSSVAVAALSLVGIILSGVLIVHHMTLKGGFASGPSFCTINQHINCDVVSQSSWSELFGFPVASYAGAFFGCLLIFSLSTLKERFLSRFAIADITFGVGAVAVAISLFFFLIAEFVIGALCLLCLGVFFVNIGICFTGWYAGDRTQSSVVRVVAGLRKVFAFPRIFLKGGSSAGESLIAGVGGLAAILAVVLAALFPGFVHQKILVPTRNTDTNRWIAEGVRQWETALPRQVPFELDNPLSGDYYKGTPGAPITIVEFSDFECPSCKRFFSASEELLKEFDGRLLVVMKNYPLDRACNPSMEHDLHKNSCYMAELTRCAGEQGKFWELTARLFALEELHDDSPEVVKRKISDELSLLSLDEEAITSCVASGRHRSKIAEDIDLANSLGIPGTPFVLINGRPVTFRSKEVLQSILQRVK